MDKVFEYLATNWPGLAVFCAAVAVIYVLFIRSTENMKLSVDTLRTSNQDLRDQLATVKGQLGDLEIRSAKRIGQLGGQVESLRTAYVEARTDLRALFDGLAGLRSELEEMFLRINDLRNALSAAADEARQTAGESVKHQERIEHMLRELTSRSERAASAGKGRATSVTSPLQQVRTGFVDRDFEFDFEAAPRQPEEDA